jgi:hypothetical protein
VRASIVRSPGVGAAAVSRNFFLRRAAALGDVGFAQRPHTQGGDSQRNHDCPERSLLLFRVAFFSTALSLPRQQHTHSSGRAKFEKVPKTPTKAYFIVGKVVPGWHQEGQINLPAGVRDSRHYRNVGFESYRDT